VATPESDSVDETDVSVVVLDMDFERVGEDVRVSVTPRLLVDVMDGDDVCESDSVLVDVSVTPGEVDMETVMGAVLVGEYVREVLKAAETVRLRDRVVLSVSEGVRM
jgi:hypothetical protein